MATVTEPSVAAAPSASAERRFFTSYAVALAVIAFVGFAPSFFLRGAIPLPRALPPLTLLHTVHGVTATLFILLFPLQAWLIASGKRERHIAVGKWGFALGALLPVLVYVLAAQEYHAPGPVAPVGREGAVVAPVSLIVALVSVLVLAWRNRFKAQAHKRLMIVAGCVLVAPAIARLPFPLVFGPPSVLFFLVVVQGFMLSTLIPLWIWDLRALGRIHRMTLLGSGVFILVIVGRTFLAPTPAWAAIVHVLPGFGLP